MVGVLIRLHYLIPAIFQFGKPLFKFPQIFRLTCGLVKRETWRINSGPQYLFPIAEYVGSRRIVSYRVFCRQTEQTGLQRHLKHTVISTGGIKSTYKFIL